MVIEFAVSLIFCLSTRGIVNPCYFNSKVLIFFVRVIFLVGWLLHASDGFCSFSTGLDLVEGMKVDFKRTDSSSLSIRAESMNYTEEKAIIFYYFFILMVFLISRGKRFFKCFLYKNILK